MSNTKEFEVLIPISISSQFSEIALRSIFSLSGVSFQYKGTSEYFDEYVEYLVVAPSVSVASAPVHLLLSLRDFIRSSASALDSSAHLSWYFGSIRDSY
mgnify:CR=1 FL=1